MTRLRELGRYVNTEGGRWFEPITTEAADEIQRLRAEVARLSSFLHPIGTIIHDNPRKLAETLGSGEHISAPFDGTVKDIHAPCHDEIERLRTELADWQRTLRAIEPDYFLLRGLVKQFVYQWEQSELGALNGKEYFSAVHALREAVRGE